MKFLFTVVLVGFFSFQSTACSFVGYILFKPTLDRWEQHPGPAQSDPNSNGEYWEPVPLPTISSIEINRADYEGNNSCKDAGTLSLTVSLLGVSTYDLDEFGIYLQVVDG
jgi:hypothetical protein